MKPTLHITNWSSVKLHGPGRKWTIMALPREWEIGEGSVPVLTPLAGFVSAVKSGEMSHETYKRRYAEKLSRYVLTPGNVCAYRPQDRVLVADGDTLCCACSRQAAGEGRCHRVWAAHALHGAGWDVVLDGRRLGEPGEEEFPSLFSAI